MTTQPLATAPEILDILTKFDREEELPNFSSIHVSNEDVRVSMYSNYLNDHKTMHFKLSDVKIIANLIKNLEEWPE